MNNYKKWIRYFIMIGGIIYFIIYYDLEKYNNLFSRETADYILMAYSFNFIFLFNLILAITMVFLLFYLRYKFIKIAMFFILFIIILDNFAYGIMQIAMSGGIDY